MSEIEQSMDKVRQFLNGYWRKTAESLFASSHKMGAAEVVPIVIDSMLGSAIGYYAISKGTLTAAADLETFARELRRQHAAEIDSENTVRH
jgi:hypothetical protein